jgi:hypothetical protein
MHLPETAISGFRELVRKEFGEDISMKRSQELAESFTRLALLVSRPMQQRLDGKS